MSERPRTGTVSGRERDEIRGGASDFSEAPRMLINSVSGDVVVVSTIIKCRAPEKMNAHRLTSFGNWNFGRLGM